MGHYVISDKTAADLAKIWDGPIERGGSEANAERLVDGFLESFQNLADFGETSLTQKPSASAPRRCV